ncbi:hypothetical protein [Parvularcula marina]|uniref:DUF2946 domain-containing protein n=1 Tax=Parvularcula marina TaxID=2292771 RepID=A0A371RK98_9PROT|nr:hypothetical protein [Parvularcula marina]RFB05885.1 hypothetical protein DX908_11770 [Parvularcula marina]
MMRDLQERRAAHRWQALGLHMLAVFCLVFATVSAAQHDHDDHEAHPECAACHLSVGGKTLSAPPVLASLAAPVVLSSDLPDLTAVIRVEKHDLTRSSRGPPLILS